MRRFSKADIERFWSKVDKERSNTFYEGTRCWEWKASLETNGYGQIKIGGRSQMAHRLAFELSREDIPYGLHALHHCDNRRCVNPNHLFLGTNQDNVDDMMSKGRHANFQGEANPSCKLSDEQVSEIRRRYTVFENGRDNVSALSKEFGISRRQTRRLVLYKSRP